MADKHKHNSSHGLDFKDYTAPSPAKIKHDQIIKTLVDYGKVLETFSKYIARLSSDIRANNGSTTDVIKLGSILDALTESAGIYVELSESMQISHENIVTEAQAVMSSVTTYQNNISKRLNALDNIAKTVGKIDNRTSKLDDQTLKIDSNVISVAVAPIIAPILTTQKYQNNKIDELVKLMKSDDQKRTKKPNDSVDKLHSKLDQHIIDSNEKYDQLIELVGSIVENLEKSSNKDNHIEKLNARVTDLIYESATARSRMQVMEDKLSEQKYQYMANSAAMEEERNTRVDGLKDEVEYFETRLIQAQKIIDSRGKPEKLDVSDEENKDEENKDEETNDDNDEENNDDKDEENNDEENDDKDEENDDKDEENISKSKKESSKPSPKARVYKKRGGKK